MQKKISDKKDLSISLQELYDDQELVLQILKDWDYKWKRGDYIIDEIDQTLNRYESMLVFFRYLEKYLSSKQSDIEEKIDVEENEFLSVFEEMPQGEETKVFLDGLANRYRGLRKPFREYIFKKRGTINHLSSISVEGIYYNPDIQTVQAGFSLYTLDKNVFQTKDDVDDFLWLSQSILQIISKAIKECNASKSPLSNRYCEIITTRFNLLEEDFEELKTLVENLSSHENSTSIITDREEIMDLSD